jgi:hypothetical protein
VAEGWRYETKQDVYFGTWMNFDVRGGNVTSAKRQQGWVSIVMSWGSRFGDLLWKLGQRLDGRKKDGDAVGSLDDGDGADSRRDPIIVDLMLMEFETDWANRTHWPVHVGRVRECDDGR